VQEGQLEFNPVSGEADFCLSVSNPDKIYKHHRNLPNAAKSLMAKKVEVGF